MKKQLLISKTQSALLEAGSEIRLDRATAEDAIYLARQFVQATLPHTDPKADTWSRTNGNFALGIQAGFNPKSGKTYGLPYGIIPRLLLFWITTEAIRTKSQHLELGNSLADFMRQVGLDPSHGGPRSDARRLQEQMQRLFQARISFVQDLTSDNPDEAGNAWLNMQVSRRGVMWWNTRTPEQGTLWNSWVELESDFYNAITAAPVPVDTRALKALKRSPLALDLYALICFEVYRTGKTGRGRTIPWGGLMQQLGANYDSVDGLKNFKAKTRAAIKKIATVMPMLHYRTDERGITIAASSDLAIPEKAPSLPRA